MFQWIHQQAVKCVELDVDISYRFKVQITLPAIHRQRNLIISSPSIPDNFYNFSILNLPISDNLCLDLSDPSISDNFYNFSILNLPISDNLCLDLSESASDNYDFQLSSQKISKKILSFKKVAVNDNYDFQLSLPEISRKKLSFKEVKISDIAEFIIVPTFRIIELTQFITEQLIEPPTIIDLTKNLSFKVKNPDGKIYFSIEKIEQQRTLDDTRQFPNKKEKSANKVRKAYLEKGENEQLSVWDLLYPLLLPPLDIGSTEQFDLYKPLRGYQQEGIRFLVENTSALLADQMGTGKTVQAVVALRILFRKAKIKSVLIVCPVSILGSASASMKIGKPEGWDGHFYYWSPELRVTVVRGTMEQRQLDWQYPAHIYITTYDTLRSDLENGNLKNLEQFDGVVLDEAQNIRNRQARRAKAVLELKTKYRWALTGTPVENKIDDVISIFRFLIPLYFKETERYDIATVQKMIAPYMLRRLKRDIPDIDLPPKIYNEEWLELDDQQKTEYEQILNEGRKNINEEIQQNKEVFNRLKISHIFPLLMKLKQICNFATNKADSPKGKFFIEFVESISENHQKILVFSQFTDEKYGLEKLKHLLIKQGIKFVIYKGGMSDRERERVVHDFKTNPDVTVFLGSVRAAGTGLNLPEADYVVHFDHWWNPAIMWQAEERAHRLGREKNRHLFVHSLWTRDTVEERIRIKLKDKGMLIEQVIDSLSVNAVEEIISTEEWLDILGIQTSKQKNIDNLGNLSIESVCKKLSQLSPKELEEKTKELLIAMGYKNARLTPISHDGGIDVFGSRQNGNKEETIVAQCKHTKSVEVNIARELLGVMADNRVNDNISKGLLVTTGTFTKGCKEFVDNNPKLEWMDGRLLAKRLIELKIVL